MKNKSTLLGLTVVIAVIVFCFTACSGGDGKTFKSPEALNAYLEKQPDKDPDKPIKVSMTINDSMLKDVVGVMKKYVSLNIIGNDLTTIPYDAFSNSRLVSITIPASVTWIGEEAFLRTDLTSVTFQGTIRSSKNLAYTAFGGDLCQKLYRNYERLEGTYTRPYADGGKEWTKK